jgi:hypothetical protein
MGFKLPGKSMTSGTSAHRSALKMKAEQNAASPVKQPLSKDYLEKNPDIESKYRKSYTEKTPKTTKYGTKTYKTAYKEQGTGSKYKTQEEFNKAADAWWASEAGQKKAKSDKKFAHRIIKKDEPTKSTKSTKTEKVVAKGEDKKAKIAAKSAKKTAEVTENVDKKTAKIAKKEAKKKYGKKSKEYLEAKQTHLKAKEADRQGEKGGRKQSIFRRLSSKINLKKQKKTQEKIDAAKKAEENA